MTDAPAADALTYEEARDALARVVSQLEEGSATLEDSLALLELGETLAARCQELLEGARARVTAIETARASGDAMGDDA